VAAVYFVIDALVLSILKPLLRKISNLKLFKFIAPWIASLSPLKPHGKRRVCSITSRQSAYGYGNENGEGELACFGAHIAMAAIFKYFVAIAVILPAVIILSAVNLGEMFVGIASIAQAPTTETPRWNIEPQMAELGTRYAAHGSLNPIYPATPGKELLGKPAYTARLANKLQEPVSAKRIDVRQALQLHKVPRQIYAASELDRIYPQQSLSYAETRPLQPRMLIIFGHGIY
jgi:hypothetical protein